MIRVGMPVSSTSFSTSMPSFSGMIMSRIRTSGRYSMNSSVALTELFSALHSIPS